MIRWTPGRDIKGLRPRRGGALETEAAFECADPDSRGTQGAARGTPGVTSPSGRRLQRGRPGRPWRGSRAQPLPLNCLRLPWQLRGKAFWSKKWQTDPRRLATSCQIWLLSSLLRTKARQLENWLQNPSVPRLPC